MRPKLFKRFLTVKPESGTSFEKVSPFFIHRSIGSAVGGRLDSCRKLRDGSLLVETANASQSDLMSACRSLCELVVKVEPHVSLNVVKGVISCYDILHATDEECKEELKD